MFERKRSPWCSAGGSIVYKHKKKLKGNDHFYAVEAITKDERSLKVSYHQE